MAFSLSNLALRAIPGAFILNSGYGKLNLDEQTAGQLQSMAANAFPAVKDLDAETFGKALAYSEFVVGGALVLPVVPSRVAGLALGAFAGGLLTMYFKTDEMTEEDGIRPSQAGTAVAKDSWIAAIALALILQSKGKKKNKKK
ncbi:hypothetical protein GMA10_07890 [Kocuria koreensis]|jgi:hypothetical protein|uniref:DoxX family membrane protein n=1 Tax=Rothia koreensis TaxID=592378 RepID=A0A7K1LIV7_9MICC|nr:hypothetical protein [Rothia koreensis]MUN55131.1 hypothetical protein [Rothia koreensis]